MSLILLYKKNRSLTVKHNRYEFHVALGPINMIASIINYFVVADIIIGIVAIN